MSFTRRALLQLLSTALLIQWPWRRLSAAPDFSTTLTAFIDTLMPADDTPAASALGIDLALQARAENDRRYRSLLQNGCAWLDEIAQRAYGAGFSELPEHQRVRVLEFIEQLAPRSPARVFFRRLQADLFELYYSHPESWPGLGIDRPPQPHGYGDYDRPPTRS